MVNAYACTSTVAPVTPCLIGSALVESGCLWLRLVLHQKRLDPVVVPPLADPIGDRSNLLRHLKALAEGLSEPLQSRAGQAPNGGEDLLDGAWIERVKAWIFLLLLR
jgi:hypothetical protein